MFVEGDCPEKSINLAGTFKLKFGINGKGAQRPNAPSLNYPEDHQKGIPEMNHHQEQHALWLMVDP